MVNTIALCQTSAICLFIFTTMKTILLAQFFLTNFLIQEQTTLIFSYEAHFIENFNENRQWVSKQYSVTFDESHITIKDDATSYVYEISKVISRLEKNYIRYEVVRNKIPLIIMRHSDGVYMTVMNPEDKTVWMLSKVNM